MCNNETDWPSLPDVPTHVEKEVVTDHSSGHIVRLVLAVLVPVAVLGILVSIILSSTSLYKQHNQPQYAEKSMLNNDWLRYFLFFYFLLLIFDGQ